MLFRTHFLTIEIFSDQTNLKIQIINSKVMYKITFKTKINKTIIIKINNLKKNNKKKKKRSKFTMKIPVISGKNVETIFSKKKTIIKQYNVITKQL